MRVCVPIASTTRVSRVLGPYPNHPRTPQPRVCSVLALTNSLIENPKPQHPPRIANPTYVIAARIRSNGEAKALAIFFVPLLDFDVSTT